MALKFYQLRFGGDVDPATTTGLTPTFTRFVNLANAGATTPPGITEIYAGAYVFQYDIPVGSQISFICDGGAALSSGRYLMGDLTALQGMDVQLGATSSSFGSTSVDPTTVMGLLKRLQEWLEGSQNFNKTTGIYTVESRGGSTVLASKTLTNSSAEVDRT